MVGALDSRALVGSLCCVLEQEPAKLSGKPDKMLGVTWDGLTFHPKGVPILLVAYCYGNRDKLRQSWGQ